MKILIILGHPSTESFNHAIAQAVRNDLTEQGFDVIFHDLYREEFPPLLPETELSRTGRLEPVVETHCRELAAADGIVIVHPNWWGQPPAIVTGWIDRVFRPGVAYRFKDGEGGEGVPVGLLRASAVVVLNTSDTPPAREMNVFGDPLEAIWRHCIFELCGVSDFHRKMFSVVVTSSEAQRSDWIEDAKALCRKAFSG